MKKNLVSIVIICSFIISAGGYMIWDFFTPDNAYADTQNLPTITRLDLTSKEATAGTSYTDIESEEAARAIISDYAAANGINEDEYPYYLVARMVSNPELTDFVLNYPMRNTNISSSDISIESDLMAADGGVPIFMQWDQRWGYTTYGSDMLGLTGCGPTCLSMVAVTLLDDSSLNPLWMAEYAMNNGYYDYENSTGTLWSFMTDGAAGIGLTASEVSGDSDSVISSLESGHILIMSMGPGNFTTSGHFIVVTGIKNGELIIHDPNSMENTSMTWDVDTVISEANNIWEYSV